ncbi:MAG: FecR protein, partial [Rhizobacter sp.]|nr:FecR protein [Rhizobacter sp.]
MTSVNKSSHRAVRGSVALLMCGVLLQAPACAAPPYDAGPVGSQDGYTVSTQDVDPPGRVGRLSEVLGQVWIYSPEDREWISAERNRPLTTGDRLSTDALGRAEMRVGSTVVRLDSSSELEVLRLDDDRLRLQLHRGSSMVRLRDSELAAQFEMVTAEGRFKADVAGGYRFDRAPNNTQATVISGQLNYEGRSQALTITAGQRAEFLLDSNARAQYAIVEPKRDAFALWNADRDRYERDELASERYVSPEMTGIEDLDRHGRWDQDPEYGAVWIPRGVAAGWAPYTTGRWTWVPPWGWTWVDVAPWGFAPFHYGRWVHRGSIWAWAPGSYVARPIYAPALVGWAGGRPPVRRPGVSIDISIGRGGGWFP